VHLCGLFDGFVNAMTAEANRQINELGEHVAREQERYNQEHKLQTETASKLATAKSAHLFPSLFIVLGRS